MDEIRCQQYRNQLESANYTLTNSNDSSKREKAVENKKASMKFLFNNCEEGVKNPLQKTLFNAKG